jgi:hypothetical protein
MIAKTFRGGRTVSGAKATLGYLMNERVEQGTDKVIKADPELTLKAIKDAAKKQKWSWSSGVLSFEELVADRKILDDIIAEAEEKLLFPGLDPDQYSIVWVRHEDKGRTELHYIAARIELSTGRAFNPYYVKRDLAKKDLFQEYINLKYSFSSPKEYERRELTPTKPKWTKTAKKEDIRKAIDEALIELIEKGLITSRDELIYQLEEWGFEVNRIGKNYISIIDEEDKKHRLKGLIYGEDFTSWTELERKAKEDGRSVASGVSRKLAPVRRELERIVERQARHNRRTYRAKRSQKTEQLEQTSREEIENNSQRNSRRNKKIAENDVLNDNTDIHDYHQDIDVNTNSNLKKGANDDSVRAEAIRRIRSVRESAQRRARTVSEIAIDYNRAKQTDLEIFEQRIRQRQLQRSVKRSVEHFLDALNKRFDRIKQAVFDRNKELYTAIKQLIEAKVTAKATASSVREESEKEKQIRDAFEQLSNATTSDIDYTKKRKM